ncbi:hypothetical protein [Geodermatophilus sp. DSM 44513]|uniref:hypothetical protein n=1 Tax=Geodermatophilus sp. DSM 44513 TaxID=1528104 RepID=UPI0014128F61|nr:hypothetical protein [Geodermatophilus sp. DSM 44513]WNV77533.1 hypothetical protein RTG05_09710 [Geodermatophilus sp. DSM 44513]
MSDEALLVALLWPLARGSARETGAWWGLRLVGPERIERLPHDGRRRGLRDLRGRRWRGLVRDSEADVVRDLEELGWTLIERRPPGDHVAVLVFSKPDAETKADQWVPNRPASPIPRLAKRLIVRRLESQKAAPSGTWPHGP